MAILVLLLSEKKKGHMGASWWCHQRDKRRGYTDEARHRGKQGDKKGKCLGKIDFLTSFCTRTKNQQSAIWISKIWPKVVKLSADCATKGTKDAVILMRSPGGKQGDKERRRKHSRDYKCSSRCNAQFIFIFLIRS